MAFQWTFANIFDHSAEVQTFAQTLEELRNDMLNKAQALVGDGAYTGQAPTAFLDAFTQMSAKSEDVIATVRNYGHTIHLTGEHTMAADSSSATTFC